MELASLSANLLLVSFIAYLVATLFFGGAVKGAKSEASYKNNRWGKIAIIITIIGFLSHLGYFITRWIASGHAPVSNMFEFMTAFGMMIVGAFILLFFLYRTPSLGLFALPIAVIIIGYASMFPREITPLIPALKSYWLTVHVITAALGEAILAISAVAGLIFLLKNVDLTKKSKQRFWLEAVMFTLILVIGFIVSSTTFKLTGYEAQFTFIDKNEQPAKIEYNYPPLFGMNEYEALTPDAMTPWAEMPAIVNAKTLTTFVWSVAAGTVLYLIIRLIFRRPIASLFQPFRQKSEFAIDG